MQSVVDVIGSALASYYDGDKQGLLIIREDNRSTTIPMSDFFQHPDNDTKDKIALSYCKRSVLNIGASSGEYSLYLLNKGLSVTSIDTSAIACSVMEKRGISSVICGDVFEKYTQLERKYTWLALKGVIGQLGNIGQFCRFLDAAQQNIYPNGRLILSSDNLHYEGYRTRTLTFEYDNNITDGVPWLDIGISTLRHIANENNFDCRVIYCDKKSKYIALLTRRSV